jgi:O-antigen/teichoic acid export membrane protein
MTESYFSNVRKQFSQYFIGNIILALAPLITFTIFTRTFTTEEYGLINIVTVTFSIVSSIAICGFPQAAVRFYESPISLNKENQFYTTILSGTFLISTTVTILLLISIYLLKPYFSSLLYKSIWVVLVSLPFTNLTMVFLALYRAEQKARAYNIVSIASKFLQVILEILFVLVLSFGLLGMFIGDLISSITVSFVLFVLFLKKKGIMDSYRKKQVSSLFSMNSLQEIVLFGFPLVLVSIMSLLLTSGDRYVLQYFDGSEAVGIYSASYNLCTFVQSLIVSPLNTAIVPILIHTWNTDGELKTKMFLSKVFKYYLLIGIPIIFGTIAIGRDILTIMATDKFTSNENILPYIMASVIIYGAYFITYAGLQISKNTKVIAQYIFLSVILNFLLNILLVPLYHITGAAIATLISYTVFFFLTTKKSFSVLSFKIELYPIMEAIFASILMYIFIDRLPSYTSTQIIILKFLVGIIVYTSIIFMLDKEMKKSIYVQLKRLADKFTLREAI